MKSMQEVIHENRERVYKARMEQIRKQQRKQEKKEMFIFCFITMFIATLTITSIIILNKDKQRCEALYNKEYCELGL